MPNFTIGTQQQVVVPAGTAASVDVLNNGPEPVRVYPSGRVVPVGQTRTETPGRGEDVVAVAANVSGTASVTVTSTGTADAGIPGRGGVAADDLDPGISFGGPGGTVPATATPGTDAWLRQWAAFPDALIVGSPTRDGNGAVTSAPVVWPDGTTGTFTGTPSVSTAALGAVDSYAVTYAGTPTKTVTQPAMTRDGFGYVTTRPALVVS